MKRHMLEMDVFGIEVLMGNPLAVVLESDGLDSDTMQRIAAWTNFSETTFVLPPTAPGADYQVRIFTPRCELPFAGHPSVGTAFAMLDSGLLGPNPTQLAMQCQAGVLPLRVDVAADGQRIVMVRVPSPGVHALSSVQAAAVCAALGLTCQHAVWSVNVGARWIVVDVGDQQAALDLQPDFHALTSLSGMQPEVGVTIFGACPAGADDAYEVRSFAPADGINEDPVCGSGNAAVAALVLTTGTLTAGQGYSARQGRACGRDGRVHVQTDAQGQIEIGGTARCVVKGSLRL